MLKGYKQELSIIIKIYIEESKYERDRDSFNFKLTIFYTTGRQTSNLAYRKDL